MAHFVLYALTSSNIDRFSNLFTASIRRSFAIKLSLKIPPHLKWSPPPKWPILCRVGH